MFDFSHLLEFIDSSKDPVTISEKIIEEYDKAISHTSHKTIDSLQGSNVLENYDLLENLNVLPDRVGGIWDSHSFTYPRIGDNIEGVFGYKVSELGNQRVFLLSKLCLNHMAWPILMSNFMRNVINIHVNQVEPRDILVCSVGVKIKHKAGHFIRLLNIHRCLVLDKNSCTGLWFGYTIDVTHLLKSDGYWSRCTIDSSATNHIYHGLSQEMYNIRKGDIISEREKEILQLIAQNKSTKEVADLLFISPSTVETHRKNMIKRTCSRDTTSLIHIARMLGIIR
jgi:DNA-binding CsgD family transcriptional regulator